VGLLAGGFGVCSFRYYGLGRRGLVGSVAVLANAAPVLDSVGVPDSLRVDSALAPVRDICHRRRGYAG